MPGPVTLPMRRSFGGTPATAVAAWSLALATSTGLPGQVRAHDPPVGHRLVFTAPDAPMPSLVVSNRGLVFLDDQLGPALNLRCDESYRPSAAEIPSVMTTEGGGLMVGLYHGVYLTADGACTRQASAGLPNATLGSVVETSDARLVTSRLADAGDAVFESLDQGASWQPRHRNTAGEYFEFLVTAPSQPDQVYDQVYAQAFARSGRYCGRSGDGARTFEAGATLAGLLLFAVHPGRPDIVFARGENPDSDGGYELLRSADGCESFERVLTLRAPPSGIAAGRRDDELWLGVPTAGAASGLTGQGSDAAGGAGLYRSEDNGASFVPVSGNGIVGVTCLARRGQRLFACATLAANESGVFYSDDGFETRTALMSFDDVAQPLACEDPTDRAVCAGPWYDFSSDRAKRATPDESDTDGMDSTDSDENGADADEGTQNGDDADDADDTQGRQDEQGSPSVDDGVDHAGDELRPDADAGSTPRSMDAGAGNAGPARASDDGRLGGLGAPDAGDGGRTSGAVDDADHQEDGGAGPAMGKPGGCGVLRCGRPGASRAWAFATLLGLLLAFRRLRSSRGRRRGDSAARGNSFRAL